MSKKLAVALRSLHFFHALPLRTLVWRTALHLRAPKSPAKPVALTLVFSDKVNLEANAVKIGDAKGDRVRTGDLRYGPDTRNIEIPLARALRPGVYSISWHAVSLDGQESVGGYDFTIDAVGQQVPAVAQH